MNWFDFTLGVHVGLWIAYILHNIFVFAIRRIEEKQIEKFKEMHNETTHPN